MALPTLFELDKKQKYPLFFPGKQLHCYFCLFSFAVKVNEVLLVSVSNGHTERSQENQVGNPSIFLFFFQRFLLFSTHTSRTCVEI